MARTTSWRVEAMEEGMAWLEDERGRRFHLPVEALPARVREGEILAVEITPGGEGGDPDGVRLRITRDHEATERAFARSVEQLKRVPKQDDPGGDIQL